MHTDEKSGKRRFNHPISDPKSVFIRVHLWRPNIKNTPAPIKDRGGGAHVLTEQEAYRRAAQTQARAERAAPKAIISRLVCLLLAGFLDKRPLAMAIPFRPLSGPSVRNPNLSMADRNVRPTVTSSSEPRSSAPAPCCRRR